MSKESSFSAARLSVEMLHSVGRSYENRQKRLIFADETMREGDIEVRGLSVSLRDAE